MRKASQPERYEAPGRVRQRRLVRTAFVALKRLLLVLREQAGVGRRGGDWSRVLNCVNLINIVVQCMPASACMGLQCSASWRGQKKWRSDHLLCLGPRLGIKNAKKC